MRITGFRWTAFRLDGVRIGHCAFLHVLDQVWPEHPGAWGRGSSRCNFASSIFCLRSHKPRRMQIAMCPDRPRGGFVSAAA
jgi:hypothetical protein